MKSDKPPSTADEMSAAALELEAMVATVAEAQQGNRAAADELVRAHDGWIRGVIFGVVGRGQLVDDIAQQVWSQVWVRLGSLKDPRRLRSWLYSVARNAAIDASQAARRRQAVDIDAIAEPARDGHSVNPVGITLGGELRAELLQAIEALPALYREPFVLRHLEDWSYAQIGELLGLPTETVETRLVRARRLLREALRGTVDDD